MKKIKNTTTKCYKVSTEGYPKDYLVIKAVDEDEAIDQGRLLLDNEDIKLIKLKKCPPKNQITKW